MSMLYQMASLFSISNAVEPATPGTGALISVAIFLLVFIAISFQLLHETAAARLGAVAVFLVTYILGSYNPALQ